MKALGVDRVRVTVLWKVVAGNARSTKARERTFRRLGADDPRAYPKLNWDRYDRLVRAAGARGIGVYLDVTFPGPAWGHETAPRAHRRDQGTWKPKPGAFGQFVKAVGRRYSGTYRDENDGGQPLPRVAFWSIGNEPNQGGWLNPYQGVDLATQASWNMLGDLLAFDQPRAIANTQFLLRDAAPLRNHRKGSKAYWFTYQSGLFFANRQPKPAAYTYVLPFLVLGGTAWGQLRFRPNGAVGDTVQLQWRPSDGVTPFANVGDPVAVTNPMGYFVAPVSPPGHGFMRAVWTADTTISSQDAAVG